MIRFTLFRVPIEIQPWFWITGALIGGAIGTTDQIGLMRLLIFMAVMTISILVHEFGHALTGRYLGGGSPRIVLWAFGGLAYNQGARLSRNHLFWMTFMGPAAGFILLALTLAVVFLIYGVQGGTWLTTLIIFNEPVGDPTIEALTLLRDHLPRFFILDALIWINFWWSVLNLIPVLPLDGGRIAELYVSPRHKALLISAITGATVAAVAWIGFDRLYTAVLFGYLAFRNYKDYQSNKW